jgi:acyl-CoA synthetase (AMP-forming)/AMP-acid ligase II
MGNAQTPLWSRFCTVSAQHVEKAAVVDAISGDSLSYSELSVSAFALSEQLRAKGAIRAIALIGEPSVRVIPLILAAARLGITIIPLADAEPEARIVDSLSALPVDCMVLSSRPLATLEASTLFPDVFLGLYSYNCGASFSNTSISEVPYLVTHSSGSTGRPKPVAFSQDTKIRRTEQSICLFGVTDADIVLSVSPFHHSLGQRHFFLALLTGATLIKVYPFRVDQWIAAVKRYKPTFAVPVATHLKLLSESILANPRSLDCFRCLVTSSAPAEPEFKRRILDSANFEFWEIYGMTETACATAIRYSQGADTGHLGKAISGTVLRIAGDEPVAEIEIKSDVLCDGYWGDSKRWKESLTPDGYFRSGDLGRLDPTGNLVYVGRSNESFQSAGLVIYPSDIESVVLEFPGVVDCVAYAVPSVTFSSLIAIWVFCKRPIQPDQISMHCRKNLPKHMWPSRIRVSVAEGPKLSSGKLDRNQIRQEGFPG